MPPQKAEEQGVCHTGALAIYILKYLKAKRRNTETQIFHHAKIYPYPKLSFVIK